MKPIIHLLVAGFLLLATVVSGQTFTTNFAAAAPTAPVGSQIAVQLRVTGMTAIAAMQFPIVFDNSALKLISVTAPAAVLTTNNFNTNFLEEPAGSGKENNLFLVPNTGILNLAFDVSKPTGMSAAANTALFTLNFEVLKSCNSTVNIVQQIVMPNGNPSTFSVVNTSGVALTLSTTGATIGGGSGNCSATPPPPPLTGLKFIANTIHIPQGEVGCMPMTVNDFDTITSMNFATNWNPQVLELQCIREILLPGGNTAADFSVFNNTGRSAMLWGSPGSGFASIPDGSAMYEVCFKAKGLAGTNSLVTPNGNGFPATTPAEVLKLTNKNYWTNSVPVADTLFVTAPTAPNAVTFVADKDTVQAGQNTCIDIKVKNFSTVSYAEFGIPYDTLRLKFAGFQLGANPLGLNSNSLKLEGTTVQNQVTFEFDSVRHVWLRWNNPAGVTLPDNTTIFSVCFKTLGVAGSLTPVEMHSFVIRDVGSEASPIACTGMGVRKVGGSVPMAVTNGHVYIKPTNSVQIAAPRVVKQVSCFGGADGGISVSASGCAANFTYAWSGPAGFISENKASLTGLKAGTYTVTVTCSAGGTASATETITQPTTALSLPTAQISATNVKCFGTNDGAINIGVAGGTAPYTFNWSGPGGFTSTNEDIAGLAGGTYTPTVTDSKGCSIAAQPITITQPTAPLAVTLVKTNTVKCFNTASGGAEITISGGTSPVTNFKWRNTANNTEVSTLQNPTGLAAGTYNVVATDPNGCTTTLGAPVTVTAPPSQLTAVLESKTDAGCGAAVGSIKLAINGGWPGTPTVSWSPNVPGGANPTGLAGGNYTPTITDAGGCTLTLPAIKIDGPTPVTIPTPQVTNLTCAGTASGKIVIAPTGGAGAPYDVTWTGGANLSGTTISGLPGGIYTPTVKDAAGCTTTLAPITVIEPSPLKLDTNITPQGENLTNGAIDLIVEGGTAGYNYAWAGPGSFTANTQDISSLVTGTYTVTVTDANSCVIVRTYLVDTDNVMNGTQVLGVKNSCNNDGCIEIQIPAGAQGPFTLKWGANGSMETQERKVSICGLKADVYSVTVSNAAGKSKTLPTQTINQLSPAAVGAEAVGPSDDQKNGYILLSPNPSNAPLEYKWDNGSIASARVNLDSGLYKVTVTHSVSRCVSVFTYDLDRRFPPAVYAFTGLQNTDCSNQSTGAVSINFNGADGPTYKYDWAGPDGFKATTKTIGNLKPGTYTVTVTDESGTKFVYDTAIVSKSVLAVTNVNEISNYNGFQVSGATLCDGKANVVFTGAVGTASIKWSDGTSGMETSKLCGGTYSVTVTDGSGCSAVWTGDLTAPPGLAPESQGVSNFNGFNVSCDGKCDGIARVTVKGGVVPYTVKWETGQTDQLINTTSFSQAVNLCGGTYKVTITDGNGATKTVDVIVTEPDPISAKFSQVEPSSFNACDGQVLVTPVGAIGNIKYQWASRNGKKGETQSAEGVCAGDPVQFVIIDQNGCRAVVSDTVAYPKDGCLQARPVITPGEQDNLNDEFFITCIETVDNTVEIYNRWGQLVFETENYNNGAKSWKGTNKNDQPLPEGIYFYVLTYTDDQGNKRQIKGYVNLLR